MNAQEREERGIGESTKYDRYVDDEENQIEYIKLASPYWGDLSCRHGEFSVQDGIRASEERVCLCLQVAAFEVRIKLKANGGCCFERFVNSSANHLGRAPNCIMFMSINPTI